MEELLKSLFSFLKRNTNFMSKDGSDKAIAKVVRQYQPSQKVRLRITCCEAHLSLLFTTTVLCAHIYLEPSISR